MSQTSPFGPDKRQTLQASAEELLQLTGEILQESQKPDLPDLGQLILQRDQLIQSLTQQTQSVLYADLSSENRESILTTLQECKRMDALIIEALKHQRNLAGDNIQALKGAHALLDKYKIQDSEPQGTRSQEA